MAKGKSLDHLQLGRGRLRLGEVVKYIRPRIHLLTSILWYWDVVLSISSTWSPHEGPPGVSFRSISPGLPVAHFCRDTIKFRSPCRIERRWTRRSNRMERGSRSAHRSRGCTQPPGLPGVNNSQPRARNLLSCLKSHGPKVG